MTYTYIKFENQTQAQKAKALLQKHSVKSYIKRNPNPNHKQGCNFALFCDGSVWDAHSVIEKNGIKNLGVESYRDRL